MGSVCFSNGIIILVVLCLKCISCLAAFENCNHLLKLDGGKKAYISSPYFPQYYPSGSSCRYTVEAPVDYELKFKCDIDFNAFNNMSCNTDIFYFNNMGSDQLSGSEFFCGSGSLERKSLMNRATISYISSSGNIPQTAYNNNFTKTGYFSCLVEAIEKPCDCGWSSTERIAGGNEAALGEFPAMAAVIGKMDGRIFCGATIIHHRFLLSAAHCFVAPAVARPEFIRILVGEDDLDTIYDSAYSQRYDIEDIIIHRHFQMTNLRNDIALLKTVLDIEWSSVVGPACLPFRFAKKSLSGYEVDTAGWGTTSFGGQQSSKLLKTNLYVLNNEVCKQSVGAMTASQFCTSSPGKDTCQYDSGGGLYLRMSRMYAVGIVSYGYACAGEAPSVNTRISTYLKWVQAQAKNVKFCVK